MSRVGKKPILVPQGVEINIEGKSVTVKGPHGQLSWRLPEEIGVKLEEQTLTVFPERRTKNSKAFWGLARALLANFIKGVSDGFEKKLELKGVGYKASKKDEKTLVLEVGYSHPVNMEVPEGLEAEVEKNVITVRGADKQKVGLFAANIRRIRPPEPYKGKGIRYVGEAVRMKESKKATGAK